MSTRWLSLTAIAGGLYSFQIMEIKAWKIFAPGIEKGLVEKAILYADLSPAAEHSVPGGKGFPNTMKKDNTIRDMGDHAFAGKVVGFIAARNDALFGKLLDEAAGLLVMR